MWNSRWIWGVFSSIAIAYTLTVPRIFHSTCLKFTYFAPPDNIFFLPDSNSPPNAYLMTSMSTIILDTDTNARGTMEPNPHLREFQLRKVCTIRDPEIDVANVKPSPEIWFNIGNDDEEEEMDRRNETEQCKDDLCTSTDEEKIWNREYPLIRHHNGVPV